MKKQRPVILLILSLILLSSSCKKHAVKPVDELSKLPAATQTGANAFGCLINGKAFVPKNRSFLLGPSIQCNYIYTAGGYHFTAAADNKNQGIIVGTDSLATAEGQTLTFKTFTPGNADASYTLYYIIGENQYVTNNTVSGRLTITKLDPVKQIVSGTFYFDAINGNGETVKITNGRFDMLYTKYIQPNLALKRHILINSPQPFIF